MNKGDISRIIEMFAEYCSEDLNIGGITKIHNTGKILTWEIKISGKDKNVR